MKTTFVIFTSTDGIGIDSFTNIKALFNGILALGWDGLQFNLPFEQKQEVFNYSNLVKKIKDDHKNGFLFSGSIYQKFSDETIRIQEVRIKSK